MERYEIATPLTIGESPLWEEVAVTGLEPGNVSLILPSLSRFSLSDIQYQEMSRRRMA